MHWYVRKNYLKWVKTVETQIWCARKETIPLIPKLKLSISYDIVSTKIYDKRDDFDFDGDVPSSTSFEV